MSTSTNTLRKQLETANAGNRDLITRLSRMQTEHAALVADKEHLNQHAAELQTRLGDSEQVLGTVTKERDQLKQDYFFRHEQAKQSAAEVVHLKRKLAELEFQINMEHRELTRLLLLEQFGGGKENELMLTRSRNRLLSALHPATQGECQQVVDETDDTRPSEEKLERTES